MATNAVLLLGNYRPTLTLARRLRPLGYRIIVTPGDKDGFAELSRDVDGVWDHPEFESDETFLVALRRYLQDHPDVTVVMPVAESFVMRLARLHDRLPKGVLYATPDPAVVEACLDKTRMLQLATACDVPCAAFAVVKDHAELMSAARRLEGRLVIRPESSSRSLDGERVLLFGNAGEVAARFASFPQDHDAIIVQEYVTGPRHNIYFAAQKGRPVRFLAAEIVRTHRANGTGLAVEGRTIPLRDDLRDYCERLIWALEFNGVGCVQFIVDEDADLVSFLEINPRIAGNHAIAEACGLGLSRLAIDLARGVPVDPECTVGPAGVRYAWTYGELRGLRASILARELGAVEIVSSVARAVVTAVRADVHMTWSWRDPKPTLALLARHIPLVGLLIDPRRSHRKRADLVFQAQSRG